VADEGYDGSPNRETHHFNINWQNDYALYHAVLGYARDLLRQVPTMTPAMLGFDVRCAVQRWCDAAWDRRADDDDTSNLLLIMRRDVGDFSKVDELAVAEEVQYGLGVEEE